MSVYGYNRRITPNLERLAAEGPIFESADSNSSYIRPSTVSFATSLQHSVLGGLRNGVNPAPEEIATMAEHMRSAGYQTARCGSAVSCVILSRCLQVLAPGKAIVPAIECGGSRRRAAEPIMIVWTQCLLFLIAIRPPPGSRCR